jgi:hypothetical protein
MLAALVSEQRDVVVFVVEGWSMIERRFYSCGIDVYVVADP